MNRILSLLIILIVSGGLSAQTVYTTKTGEKYHTKTCRYLKYSKKELTLERALELGYEACSVCDPPTTQEKKKSNSNSSENKKSEEEKPKQKATATQCTGKTKAGSRCKRMTKNANGRCYQHQ